MKMKELGVRGQVFAYAALFLVALVVFAVLRIPSDRLAQVAVAHAQNAGYRIAYDQVRGTLAPGFQLRGVQVYDLESETKLPVAELDQLSVRTRVFSLLRGRPGARVSADAYGGSVQVNAVQHGEALWLSGNVDGIELEQIENIQRRLQVPLKGSVNADFDFELMSSMMHHVGGMQVVVDELHFEPGSLVGMFQIPGIHFGDVHGSVLLENGRLIFDRFAGQGQDVEIAVEGSVNLQQPITRSGLNLELELGLSDRVEESLGFALQMLNLNKNPQGDYVRRVTGTLGSPR